MFLRVEFINRTGCAEEKLCERLSTSSRFEWRSVQRLHKVRPRRLMLSDRKGASVATPRSSIFRMSALFAWGLLRHTSMGNAEVLRVTPKPVFRGRTR
jgi:hypothetical protein